VATLSTLVAYAAAWRLSQYSAIPMENTGFEPVTSQKTAQHYYALIHGINNRPRRAAMRKALKALRHDAESLLNTMQAFRAAIACLDDASREVIWRQAQPPVVGLERLEYLTDQAQWWYVQAGAHLS
jgi:hypothetical protein